MKKGLFGIVDLRMLQGQQSHQARSCIAGGVVGYTIGCDLVELPLCEEGGFGRYDTLTLCIFADRANSSLLQKYVTVYS
jgi:hypothetical protein